MADTPLDLLQLPESIRAERLRSSSSPTSSSPQTKGRTPQTAFSQSNKQTIRTCWSTIAILFDTFLVVFSVTVFVLVP